ncbi:copper fist DNA binding domain-containing protein [Umbelopsis sp. PMI_123]|nr:copper fist DNA binding domain-containing protein [Umbelopsis sp. PMI_123]
MLIVGEDGVVRKYSCEKCIKGHRTSGCKHSNSPLFEIKKKGRPSTQCEQCRELRKTKHMHVKCICHGRQPGSLLYFTVYTLRLLVHLYLTQFLESKSRIRPTPYSREPSPNHSRESSPLHMDVDIANVQQIVGGTISMDCTYYFTLLYCYKQTESLLTN